ncbi:MAG TPA: zf-HC2 domain-containing protein [Urbifossiella sp.]|nr:zf-HC2 domain-containing protein [Urbifossiella sp.]
MNLTCRQLRELLYEHHAGELAVEHRLSFQTHLEQCQDCTFYVESYTHTVRFARKLAESPLPTDTETRLRAALKDHL